MTLERDTSLSDDPFDMETSEALALEGPFLLAKEAGAPLSSRLAGAEVDFSFLDGAVDAYAPRSPGRHGSLFLEKRTWSSLAIVLLLHATFACIFPVFGKPSAQSPKTIEAQLVLLPGGSGLAAGQPAGGETRSAKGAKSVFPARHAAVSHPPARVDPQRPKSIFPARPVPAPPPPARIERKPLKPVHIARVHKMLSAVRKIHARARKRPVRVAGVSHHPVHHKEVMTPQPIKNSQTKPGEIKSQNPVQKTAATAPGTGRQEAGAIASGGPGKIAGPGGPGSSDVAFGSADGPRFLHKVAPVYPALARKLQMQGTVLLRVTIDARGRAVRVVVLRKAGFGMDKAAVKAVEESTFAPARRRDGLPFTCKALLPIKFVLDAW